MIVLATFFACLMGTRISARSSDPTFTQEPYVVTIPDSMSRNTPIFTVTAFDPVPKGPLNFESIGIHPAQRFFDVDRLTGEVFVTRSLKKDKVARESYTLRVITFDETDPDVSDTADVTITVIRNPGTPEWSEDIYEKTVNEEHAMRVPVLTVLATDSDGDTVTYSIVEDTTGSDISGGNSLDYFFVNSDGEIHLRKLLTDAPLDQYSFTVSATDSGIPKNSATVTVKIFITRVVPAFHNTPYSTRVNENAPSGTQIFTVTATDANGQTRRNVNTKDIYTPLVFRPTESDKTEWTRKLFLRSYSASDQGMMMYGVIGIGVAPAYFYTGINGQIYTRGSLTSDTSTAYTLRVVAFDSLTQNEQATADVTITVDRN